MVKGALQKYPSLPTIIDLDQTPSFKPARYDMPTLTIRFLYWSLRCNRAMLGDEALLSQGLPVVPGIAAWSPPWGNAWRGLSEQQKFDLAGNTINLKVLMSLLAFCSRVAVPRGWASICRALEPSIDEDPDSCS